MLQDAPLDCDANAEVLSGAETETLLENVEMTTSTTVPAETKNKNPFKPTEIAAKRQKAQATYKSSMCVMQRAVRKHETTSLKNASKFDRMPTEVPHKLLQDFNLQFDGAPVQYVSHQVHRQRQTLENLQKNQQL